MDSARVLRALLSPQIIARHFIRSFSLGSVEFRLAMQALERAEYAFGVRQAIYLAAKLKHSRVSVLEFGVASGNGLKWMEHYASELGKKYGITVEVYGFDLGTGLPPPADYRDVPYIWSSGHYRMDADLLQSQLKSAKLILGEVRETLPRFVQGQPAPIGFISFDLDYYSSTVSAFQLFDSPDQLFLPRVICYFDDVGSDGRALQCDYVGELRAIREFNERPGGCHKLCPAYIREPIVHYSADWLHKLWVYHRFSHADYNSYLDE
jgi:hypothetical protein